MDVLIIGSCQNGLALAQLQGHHLLAHDLSKNDSDVDHDHLLLVDVFLVRCGSPYLACGLGRLLFGRSSFVDVDLLESRPGALLSRTNRRARRWNSRCLMDAGARG